MLQLPSQIHRQDLRARWGHSPLRASLRSSEGGRREGLSQQYATFPFITFQLLTNFLLLAGALTVEAIQEVAEETLAAEDVARRLRKRYVGLVEKLFESLREAGRLFGAEGLVTVANIDSEDVEAFNTIIDEWNAMAHPEEIGRAHV